jgi:multiple sugar transport system substrate-binding protein
MKLRKIAVTITAMLMISIATAQTITLWHWETPPARVSALEVVLERYQQETGVRVEQVPINFPDYQTRILASIAANRLPELLLVNPPQVPLLLEHNAIVPVDELFTQFDASYEFPAAVAAPYRVEGNQYALPIFGVYWPLTYRADLYEEAGLAPPETWEDLREAAERLTIDTNGDGTPDIYGMCLPVSSNGNYGSQVVWSFVRSNGGDIVQVRDGVQEIVFDSPENVETFRYLADLAQFSPPGRENMDWGATELLIKSGRCANVMYNGAWMRELAENDPDLLAKYAMKEMPRASGGQVAHTGYPRAVVVTRQAERNLDAVVSFLEWLYQPENHAELLLMEPGLFMPVTAATANSDAFLDAPVIRENRELVAAQASIADSIWIIGFTGEEPAPHASQIESSFMLGRVLQRIVLEGHTPEDAVAWGARQYRDIIR